MNLQPYEINNALDFLMEHYDEGKYSPDDEDKPMTQIQRNMRSKMKKQLEEFCETKQKSMFMMAVIGMCEYTLKPQRLMDQNRKLRHQVSQLEKEREGEMHIFTRQKEEQLKAEYKEKFEKDNEEVLKDLTACRARNRKYMGEMEKAHQLQLWVKSQKILTPEEWSDYNSKKAELTVMGLYEQNTPIQKKMKELMEKNDKSSTGKELKKYKKINKKLKLRIQALEAEINSSSSSSSCEEDDEEL